MNIEDIEKFLTKDKTDRPYIKIYFKKRQPVYGIFVKDRDYNHLKSKNFWRIVTTMHLEQFERSADMSLARIFNGAEFSRLALSSDVVS